MKMTNSALTPDQVRSRKLVLFVSLAGIIVIGLVILWATLAGGGLKIENASPSGILPTSSKTIRFTFNQNLKAADEQPENYITFEPDIERSVEITDDALSVTIISELEQDSRLSIIFNEIRAASDDSLSEERSYSVQFVPFNELSLEEQRQQSEQVGQPRDENPLLVKLPYDELAFRVEYVTDNEQFGSAASWQEEKDNYAVIVYTFAPKILPTQDYINETNTLRNNAKDWIREQGVNPENDINILYIPNDDELAGTVEFSGDGIPPEQLNDEPPSSQ